MTSHIEIEIRQPHRMEILKKRMGAILAWIGFATLLFGPTAAILTQSTGLLAVSASIWLLILTTSYGINSVSLRGSGSCKLTKLIWVVSSDWEQKPERHYVV